MAFPAGLTLVTVAIRFDLLPDGGASGTVRFSNARALLGTADNSIVPYVDTVVTLAADGTASVSLPATNDPQWSPLNFAYDVTANVGARTIRGTLQLDHQTTSVALADLLQVDGAAESGVSYLLVSQRSAPSGVAGLDADGDVIDAAGNKVAGAAGADAVDVVLDPTGYAVLTATDVQVAFDETDAALADAAGALLAANNLSDLANAATARTSLGLGNVATRNVGTTAGTAAAGDHTHADGGSAVTLASGYVTSGNITPQNTSSAWQLLTGGPTFAIAATAGDVVEFEWAGLINPNSATSWDLAVIVSGAAVRYASTGTATPATDGDPSLYYDPAFQRIPGPFRFTVAGGDVSGGNVTIGFAVRSAGAGVLYAGTDYPLRWSLTNFGGS